jgi:NAD(P)H-dependent flavin oxidoreductase YrpB (nitropropane dioxygenase family)
VRTKKPAPVADRIPEATGAVARYRYETIRTTHVEMPSLTIGRVTSRLPIIQGGMAVRISMAPLAAAVASAGGIGVIAGSGLTVEELRREIRAAKAATDGVIGVNIMVAVRNFADLVKAAIEEGIDLVISGAGFSRDVFEWTREAGVPMVPIVGSPRVAQLSERFGAAAVVVEGHDAGGHLGTDKPVRELLPSILESVSIPVVAAGNIVDGHDICEILRAGAAGVQMGARFAATVESSASAAFKQMYVDATEEDMVLIDSPVGLPGRALRNPLTERLAAGIEPRIERCIVCLKKCGKQFCIMDKLVRAQTGDVEDGLVFTGGGVGRIHDIPTVRDLIDRLVAEYGLAAAEVPA